MFCNTDNMEITVKQLAQAIKATISAAPAPAGNPQATATNPEDITVSIALTDSRSLTEPDRSVFFALRTDVGDGFRFIPQLYERGVRVFVTDKRRQLPQLPGAVFLVVDDVMQALTASGAWMRDRLGDKAAVIAITGSRGKTVVKEMLCSALKQAGLEHVARSPRSYNSAVGVPLSLWTVKPDDTVAVIEAGISRDGEMQTLADEIRPTVGIFTDLTDEHDRGFASREHKIRQKALLFAGCSHIIYNSRCDSSVGRVLGELYGRDRNLIACDDYAEMVRAAAGLLGVSLQSVPAPVQSRLDITESVGGTTVAYDYFTCDRSGIAVGLDILRRRVPHAGPLTAIIDPAAGDAGSLASMLRSYGVTRVITDSPQTITSTMSPSDFYDSTVYINGCDKPAYHQLYTWLSNRRNITRMEINLDALAHNFRHYRSLLPQQTGLVAMIKASAYGCGDVQIARTLQSIGADALAVAVVDEGVSLRRGGVTLPIIVLDPYYETMCENMRAVFDYSLQPTIINPGEDTLTALETNADAAGVDTIDVHLKLDTGMHRVGLHEEQLPQFMEMLKRHPRIRLASMFSHLATADCLDMNDYTARQLDTFRRMTDYVLAHVGYPVKRHILNTAGITRFGHSHVYELARLGIGLYGLSPLGDGDAALLRPVARLVTSVINLSVYNPGDTVGYGCHGQITRPSVIATIPVGYADGIDRRLGNGGARFWIGGKLCPTIGNICMDLCMVDVTDLYDSIPTLFGSASSSDSLLSDAAGVHIGDEVEIFGPHAPITAISEALGTIHYEVLARVSPRVKRVYYRE